MSHVSDVPIGQEFTSDGERYVVREDVGLNCGMGDDGCGGCAFRLDPCVQIQCKTKVRHDGKNVYLFFKKKAHMF